MSLRRLPPALSVLSAAAIVASSLLSAANDPLYAQQVDVIRGRVTSQQDRQPVEGAQISHDDYAVIGYKPAA